MSFIVRPGTMSDVPAVGALHTLSRQNTYNFIKGYRPKPLEAYWRARFEAERESHRLFVAESGSQVVGFAYAGEGWLHAIHVHPSWHGKGVGRALLRVALEALRERGFSRAELWVLEGNERACRFYEQTGWRRTGDVRLSEIDDVPTRQLRYVRDLSIEMWNNPACSKCAAARSALAGQVTLRSYLDDPPSVDELADVLRRLGARPWEICRLGEPVAATLGLAQWPQDDSARDRWIAAMAAHPELIQRPILLFPDGTALVARTPEALARAVAHNRENGSA